MTLVINLADLQLKDARWLSKTADLRAAIMAKF
jgi:hypothetical protein